MSNKNNAQKEEQNKKKRIIPLVLLGIFGVGGLAAGATLIGLALTKKAPSLLHTITFNTGDAIIVEGSNTSTFENNVVFNKINKPTLQKDNCVFEGWYKSNNFTPENKIKDTDTISLDMTIYANFVSDTQNYIIFSAGDTGATLTGNTKIAIDGISEFQTYNKPTVTFKDGKVFDYWQNGDKKVEDKAVLTSTTKLTPHGYNPLAGKVSLNYKLRKDDEDAGAKLDGLTSYTIENGFEFAKCTKPTPSFLGKMFDKWVDEKGNDIPTYITTDTTAYAQFKNVDVEEKTYITINSKLAWLTNDNVVSGKLIFADLDGKPHEFERDKFNEPITIGSKVTEIPSNFLFNCTSFNQSISFPEGLTSIGDDFLSGCKSFNQKIDTSGCTKLTKIGSSFLQNATSFNKEVVLSNTITTIKYCFMYDCIAYNNDNKAFALPTSLTKISNSFLEGCKAFNVSITNIGNIKSIGAYFLSRCSSFNQVLSLNTDATISDYFLYYCTSFNSALTLPTKLTSIPKCFLYECQAFNQTLSIPSGVTKIDDYFMYDCLVFNQSLTIPGVCTTIGAYFLNFNKAFDQELTIPSSIQAEEAVGVSFMYYCCNVTAITINTKAECFAASNLSFATGMQTQKSYNPGITITSDDKEAIIKKFPKNAKVPWRNLI